MHFLLLLSFTVWVGMCATSSSDDLAQYEDSFTRNVAGDSVDADPDEILAFDSNNENLASTIQQPDIPAVNPQQQNIPSGNSNKNAFRGDSFVDLIYDTLGNVIKYIFERADAPAIQVVPFAGTAPVPPNKCPNPDGAFCCVAEGTVRPKLPKANHARGLVIGARVYKEYADCVFQISTPDHEYCKNPIRCCISFAPKYPLADPMHGKGLNCFEEGT